jgi:hypothetical protein
MDHVDAGAYAGTAASRQRMKRAGGGKVDKRSLGSFSVEQ